MQDAWGNWRRISIPANGVVQSLQLLICQLCGNPFLLVDGMEGEIRAAAQVSMLSRLAQSAILPLWEITLTSDQTYRILRVCPKKSPLSMLSDDAVYGCIEEFRSYSHTCGRSEWAQ